MENVKDLENLKKIEATIGKKLKQIPLKDIWGLTNGYSCNGEVNIIGLNLIHARIPDISFVRDFTKLTHLNLVGNKISDLSHLNTLTNLTELSLSSNKISDISPLKSLKNLTVLWLTNNQISDISQLLPLKKLKRLGLRNNNLSQLSVEWTSREMEIKWKDDRKDGIFLEGNPLQNPPVEIVIQGTAAFQFYFKELKKEKTVHFLESKLLIVGNGEVGKTSLMKKLKDNNFQLNEKEPTTHGINIQPWQLTCPFDKDIKEKVNIHFWDFGGQDIYHATHQFFLTKRSLYLFVWEARKEEESRSFDYWLNIINLLSDNSPVIVIMNKSDVRIKHIDEAIFKDKFKKIVSFEKVSCLTGKGIPDLTEQIRIALGNMPHLRDTLPEVWLKIRDRLKNEKKNYIHIHDYFKICKEFGLDEERAEFLSGYLHDLGIILHYRHDRLLENTVILNPEWATGAVYKLLDTLAIQENKGQFMFDDLKTIWDANVYPMDKHLELTRLMEKFELCFNITGTHIYIIPELLPPQRPAIDFDTFRAQGSLHFLYQYDFMPEGIISRFISRNYYFIRNEQFWKTGAELTFEDSHALVVSDTLKRKLNISVTGPMKGELLAIIRKEMEHIHQVLNLHKEENSHEMLPYTSGTCRKKEYYHEMLPCTCGTCGESEDPHLYEYKMLNDFSEKGFPLHCPRGLEPVSIEQLLKGYKKQKPRHSLKEEMVTTASELLGVAGTIKEDEDSRNGFMALILSIKGFMVKDQTRWGRSASGKSMGRIDFKVELPDKGGYAICEAFRLKGFDGHVIDSHLKKLFSYDPAGVKENFIIVYAETDDFSGLWEKYLQHIPEIDFECPLHGEVEEESLDYANIKLARAQHVREKIYCDFYHLFVKMPQSAAALK
jgi:internalin A